MSYDAEIVLHSPARYMQWYCSGLLSHHRRRPCCSSLSCIVAIARVQRIRLAIQRESWSGSTGLRLYDCPALLPAIVASSR